MKIAFISNHPAPYRDVFLSRLVTVLSGQIDVYSELPYDIGHSFWNLEKPCYNAEVLVPEGTSKIAASVAFIRRFVFGNYDFVMWPGLMKAYIVLPMLMSALIGRRYGFVADTVEQKRIHILKRWLKSFLVKHASVIFVPGKAGKEFWMREYGVNEARICLGAYSLDGEALERQILAARKDCNGNVRSAIRARLGVEGDEAMFLMVANMIPTRHYPITTEGFLRFQKEHPKCKFVIVGRGPELSQMQSLSEKNTSLKVISGCSFNEMLDLYVAADVYVHGGKEPASTALVIGAIANLPILASSEVGCRYDVVSNNISGVLVGNYLSAEDWHDSFCRIYEKREEWAAMGWQARVMSKTLDVDNCVKNFLKVLNQAC